MNFKRLFYQLVPDFAMLVYKRRASFKIVKNYDSDSQPELKLIQKTISKSEIFVDIGANIGLYTCLISPYARRTLSFEPVPFTYRLLKYNIRKFDLANVDAYPLALSNKENDVDISIPMTAEGVPNYYRASIEGPIGNNKRVANIQQRTLDEIVAAEGYNDIGIIKCDVEGHELECLKGAAEVLRREKPILLVEVNEKPENDEKAFRLFSFLNSLGYESYILRNAELVKRREGSEAINHFFLKNAHLERIQEESL